ncbi:hypothetical protein GGI15_000180 [Coemansia interrupta]|uniref:Uncharacterized protein n=1 Tax=Coemansia interrupta TaxID=1126814 RepID=A0A9W8HMC1_9FUNG|nr:hypothetical protein GGI15_000180 [Coemansia interrupta]
MATSSIGLKTPCFRVKRASLTLFVETKATSKVASIKEDIVTMLENHSGGDDLLVGLTPNRIRLVAEQAQQPDQAPTLRPLDDSKTIKASELVDDQVLYFVLQLPDGTVSPSLKQTAHGATWVHGKSRNL